MMKKITLFFLFIPLLAVSQTIFNISNLHVSGKDWNSLLKLYDDYYSSVEFDSGGVVIDRIILGDGEFNIRIARYGDLNNWGIKTERPDYQGPAFWRGRNDFVNDYGPSYAGTSLWYSGSSNPSHRVQQRWFLKVDDPQKFMTAFEQFMKDTKKMMGDRWIAVAAYTANSPKGATHSVGMAAENWVEMEQLRAQILQSKAFENFIINRGEVEDVGNIMYRRMRHYNNERNKKKTFDDMW